MSRRAHLTEASLNTLSGFLISFVVTQYLTLALGYQATWHKSFWLVFTLTIVSVLRNYFWRRFFHNQWHERFTWRRN